MLAYSRIHVVCVNPHAHPCLSDVKLKGMLNDKHAKDVNTNYFVKVHDLELRHYSSESVAQVQMGQWYKTGEYTLEQDSKVSMDWFDMAAGQGDTVGQYEYGLCFLHERMEMDDMSIGNAALWFGKSADQGKIMSSCTI